MITLISLLATAALTTLALWTLKSRPLRVFGGLLVIAALADLALDNWPFAGALMLAPGLIAWLAGHLLYVERHHRYASPLAAHVLRTLCRVFRQPDPTRR